MTTFIFPQDFLYFSWRKPHGFHHWSLMFPKGGDTRWHINSFGEFIFTAHCHKILQNLCLWVGTWAIEVVRSDWGHTGKSSKKFAFCLCYSFTTSHSQDPEMWGKQKVNKFGENTYGKVTVSFLGVSQYDYICSTFPLKLQWGQALYLGIT